MRVLLVEGDHHVEFFIHASRKRRGTTVIKNVGGESRRLHVRSMHTGAKPVVGQQTAARDQIARACALRTVLPLLALIPVLLLLVGVIVRHALKPIRVLVWLPAAKAGA